MQVVVDGLMTNYQKTGQGKTVLLVHGWGDSSKTYASLTKDLAKKYEVIALDLPGFGGTQAPSAAWGLDEYAAFIKDWLLKIDTSQLYGLVGHSNGAAIAIRALIRGDLDAEKLVLLAAAGVRGEYNPLRQARKVVVKAGKFLSTPLPRSAKRKLKAKAYQASGSEALLYPELEDSFRKIVAQDVRADAAKIHQPTLLIYGTADTATPPRFGRMYAQIIKNSRLEPIENAGHFVHQEQANRVNGLVEDFLNAK